MTWSAAADSMSGPYPGTASATDTRPPQRMAGTGTTEATVTHPLTKNRMATILVGAVAVRFRLTGSAGSGASVATTDPAIPAYGRFDWLVDADTCYPHVQAADGSAAYEAHAFTSSKAAV